MSYPVPIPKKPKRKIVNFICEPGHRVDKDVFVSGATIVLCNDGTLWRNYTGSVEKWFPFPPIPQDDPKEIKTDTNFSIEQIEEMQKRINEEGENA